MLTHAPPPLGAPFGSADYVEGRLVRAIDVGGAMPAPEPMVFVDGIQRYAVEGRIRLVPIVRGYVAAAALRRERGELRVIDSGTQEFIVAPLRRLTADQRTALERSDLPLLDCTTAERSHPILDVQLAAKVVEHRRERIEIDVTRRTLVADPETWMVVDGSLAGIDDLSGHGATRVLGLVKSHETQFLDGPDLEVALTLRAGHRTSVFARTAGQRATVYTWYLRLWPWEDHELLHGLVRIERPPSPLGVDEATSVSRWLLSERAPLSAPDSRWDRLVYPIQQVETYLRALAGGWW
jgi:hypothetical protein